MSSYGDHPYRKPARRLLRMSLGLFTLFAAPAAFADVRCVSTAGELVSAFNDANAGVEGSTWDIRVRPGTYQLNASLKFEPAGDHDNKVFYLSGGWNAGCSSQTGHAAGTVVRGIASTPNSTGTQFVFVGNNNRYDIENIRFEDFHDFLIVDPGCAPYNICPGTAAVVIDHSEFDNGEYIDVVTYDSPLFVFRNNLVTNMAPLASDSPSGYPPVELEAFQNGSIDISFNTFARLTCLTSNGGVEILAGNPNARLHHNIVQTTGCTHDVYIDPTYGGQVLSPWNNLFLSIANYSGNLAGQGNVLAFDPTFVDAANGNFRLQNASPAVNAGMTLLGAIQMGFFGPGLDLDGNFRPTGLHYDIGAYESAVNDGAPQLITVTNTSDDANDSGSLRHAIAQANSQVGTPQEIVFDIAGACPHVIYLESALPDVTDPLYINGYSQPGAVANDLDVGTDASICVVVVPNNNAVGHAVQVPNGQPDTTQLIVTGVGFGTSLAGAFTGAAVELRAGSGHKIAGSVFGGLMPNDGNIDLYPLQRGVLIRGTAADVTIGGDDNASRNTFGPANLNAIVITDSTTSGHVIQNNYIGLTPNGLNPQANALDGISATGGTNVKILDNVIAASMHGIYVSGAATTGFTIQGNQIGVNAIGIGLATHANDVGIQINGGSGQHTIGGDAAANLPTTAFAPGGIGNDIRNNHTAGINLTNTAGAYISIRGNRLEANGRDGVGLGIDLGVLGQLANDAGDGDSGPDTLQNHPVMKGSAPNGATRQVIAALNTAANQAVRIDFYRSPLCPKGATGANATTYVGSIDVNSGATGVLKSIVAQVANAGAPAYLTATATTNVGNTSELAPCFAEDTIFVDGQEPPGL